MEAIDWSHKQFWGAALDDVRLERRLVEVAARLRERPRGVLTQSMAEPSELKGAYRLFGNAKVTHGAIIAPHVTLTRGQCREPGNYLIIEDTTDLSFTHRGAIPGMGPLTKKTSQGILAHTSLAVRIAHWDETHEPAVEIVGLFGQRCWARARPQGTRAARKKVKRSAKRKGAMPSESDRWGAVFGEEVPLPAGVRHTLVADRECDIFDVVAGCAQRGVDWIIRAAQVRKTSDGEDVFAAAAHAPVLGRFTLELRERSGVPARTATVEVRAVSTQLMPPREVRGRHDAQAVGLVEAREINPPDGVEPVHWVLLTSWPCANFERARRIVAAYACRWIIEEFHKALKTGTRIEDSQLSTARRVQGLLAVCAVVAVELVRIKFLARTQPDAPVAATVIAPEMLEVLALKRNCPASGWTYASAIHAIARMGGYLGRKHDGPPGWLTIWRGYQRLILITEGYVLVSRQKTCG
jgi:hypothetical protein